MHTARMALVIVLAAGAAACRQADAPIPTPSEAQKNDIGDIARDLVNIVNKDPEAPADLSQDLSKYFETPDAIAKSRELARRMAAALPGGRLDDQSAQRLAHTLWIALASPGISQRQFAALQEDVKSILTAGNVSADRAQPVVDQLGEVHALISTNPKRWYHVF